MQIREQGKQVQLIRSPYNPVKKRCVQKVVHTFKQQYEYKSDDVSLYLSASQLADFTDVEKSELSAWLKKQKDDKTKEDRARTILLADVNLGRLANAVEMDAITVEKAAEIWASISILTKALKKAGHPKPVKAVIQDNPVTGDQSTVQGDLLPE